MPTIKLRFRLQNSNRFITRGPTLLRCNHPRATVLETSGTTS